MPDPTKKKTTKRDLATPLAESRFEPADYNKDGSVSTAEKRKYTSSKKAKKEYQSSKFQRRYNLELQTKKVANPGGFKESVRD